MLNISFYQHKTQQRFLGVVGLIVLVFLLCVVDIQTGSSSFASRELLRAFLNGPGSATTEAFILWDIRLPMTLTCLFVGASLSLSGLLIQTITANPLASPYTLGVTAGSSFGAAIAITFNFAFLGQLWLGTSLMALIFALLVSTMIFVIGRKRAMTATTLVLTGIITNFFFQALQQYLQYKASPEIAQLISSWSFGNLQRASWTSVSVVSVCWVLGLSLVIPRVWQLTALGAGQERAQSLGLNVYRLRIFIFTLCSILVASAVSFIGTVAFVGLIAPHGAKLLLGEDQRFLLPAASLLGSALMLSASIVSKLLSEGATLPVGIVTSVIGVPFLLTLLLKSKH